MIGKPKQLRNGIIYTLLLISVMLIWLGKTRSTEVSRAQSGQDHSIASQPFNVPAQGPFRSPLLKSPPTQQGRGEREHEEHDHPTIKTPIDPTVRPEDIR